MSKKKNNEKDWINIWSEKVTYMLLIGVMGIVCSVPIITIGASMTAMQSSMMLYVTEDDKHIIKNFFAGFKMHFAQSTLIWLMNFVLMLVLMFDMMFYGGTESWVQIAGMSVITISLMIIILETVLSFVIVAKGLTKGVKDTLQTVFRFAMTCPYESLGLLVLNLVIPGILMLFAVQLFSIAPGILCFMGWQFLPKAFEKMNQKVQ